MNLTARTTRTVSVLLAAALAAALAFAGGTAPVHATSKSVVGSEAPFSLDRDYSLAKAAWNPENRVRVFSDSPEPGSLTVTTANGEVITQKVAKPRGQTWLRFPKPKKFFTRYTITATAADGRSVTWPFAVINAASDTSHYSSFEPCSTITWAYDDRKAPQGTRAITKDLRKAMRIVAKNAGVQFTPAADRASADLVFTWGKANGHAAVANYPGEVEFSRSARINRDSRAGAGAGDRVWLIVHEILHILGLQHTKERDSVMYPYMTNQKGLSRTDKALLKALYTMHPCPA